MLYIEQVKVYWQAKSWSNKMLGSRNIRKLKYQIFAQSVCNRRNRKFLTDGDAIIAYDITNLL